MVGMSLPVDGICDYELKIKGISDIEIGDWTRDSEAAPSQASSGNSAANSASTASRSQGPSLRDNGDPGDALQLLQSEEDCEVLEFTLRGED